MEIRDALIAATTIAHNELLCTGKHQAFFPNQWPVA
jgi:predicted nucleic acid-binding protein